MKRLWKLLAACAAALSLVVVAPSVGYAGGKHHHGHRHHGHKHHSHRHHGWGHRHHNHGPRITFGFGFGGPYYHSYRPYYRPYYAPPPVVYAPPPVQYVQPPVQYVPPAIQQELIDPSQCKMVREYQTQIVVGGRLVDAYGDACLQEDGSWRRGPPKLAQ